MGSCVTESSKPRACHLQTAPLAVAQPPSLLEDTSYPNHSTALLLSSREDAKGLLASLVPFKAKALPCDLRGSPLNFLPKTPLYCLWGCEGVLSSDMAAIW